MVHFVLVFIFWFDVVSGMANVHWSLNGKLKTIENSLINNKHLQKFSNITHKDTAVFDVNKAKRSYENTRCIRDLQWIQENINNPKNGWAFECK